MSDPRLTIAQLRAELMELAEAVSGYASLPKPDRFEWENPHKVGPEWHVPSTVKGHRSPRLVRVITGEPEVFVEGGGYLLDGDMEAMTTREARAYAMALLAAADWADGQDVVGERRVERER